MRRQRQSGSGFEVVAADEGMMTMGECILRRSDAVWRREVRGPN